MGFKSFFTAASKEPETGVGSKGRLEGQRLKHRQSFVNVPKSRVAEKSLRFKKLSTEQLVPSKRGSQPNSCFSILKRDVLHEDIHLRVLLLSPFSNKEAVACEKSIIDACSRTGSVMIEMMRLSGAAEHHFRLYVTADEGSVHVVLPSKFRGVIHIQGTRSLPTEFVCSAELRKLVEEGDVRLNAAEVGEDEDEVFILAGRHVQFQLEAEKMEEPGKGAQWVLESRMSWFRRLLFMP